MIGSVWGFGGVSCEAEGSQRNILGLSTLRRYHLNGLTGILTFLSETRSPVFTSHCIIIIS